MFPAEPKAAETHRQDGDPEPSLRVPARVASDLQGNEKTSFCRKRVSYITAASTNPIISVVTQSALFKRNICN